MKVGIITFHRAINYGALLQVYALQKEIGKTGCTSEVLDYRCEIIENVYKPFKLKGLESIKHFAYLVLHYPIKRSKINKFRQFTNRYISIGRKMESSDSDINDIWNNSADKYDLIITGSDQVWNCNCTNFDKRYFLNFNNPHTRKASYAASFGFNEIPQEYIKEYQELLEDFDRISVREIQGVKIMEDLLKRQVPTVLDPTLLLGKDEWSSIAKEIKVKKNYILVYLIVNSRTIFEFAEELSKKTGYDIICISDDLVKKFDSNYARGIGPEEFLGLFKNASYVVTNSFHGTAFSVGFEKDFFTELLEPPSNVNSRLVNILELLGLEERQIINGKNSNFNNSINYEKVNRKLEIERKKSRDYLKSILRKEHE